MTINKCAWGLALILTATTCFAQSNTTQPKRFSLTLLGFADRLTDVNNAGSATGYSLWYTYLSIGGAFSYRNGTPTWFGGANHPTFPVAINNSGKVVGRTQFESFPPRAFLYDGAMHDLGTLGGTQSFAASINDAGLIVGGSFISDNSYVEHAFVYDGKMHDLGTLFGMDGENSEARGVNAAGTIVGISGGHVFLYDGSMHDLGAWYAAAINNLGYVTGAGENDKGYESVFLYNGSLHDLGTLGGPWGTGTAINSRGEVVGYAGTASFVEHAFLYTGGTMYDLNDLVSCENCYLSAAWGINDRDEIVGEGWCVLVSCVPGSNHFGFILKPLNP